MLHDLRVLYDASALALTAATYVAARARLAVKEAGRFLFALSGGTTSRDMLEALASQDIPWEHVVIYQVDERVAPPNDPNRKLRDLEEALGEAPAKLRPMPVGNADLDAAAVSYATSLPEHLDLIQLCLGADGHTASLVPGDHVLEVADRLVALTGPYQGYRRMTLTYPALSRAGQLLWLVSGEAKREALSKLMAGDPSIPAGRVEARASMVLADQAAT